MKVLLICVSGITTNILSKRLQNYSKEQGFNDKFIPCRIGSSDEIVDDVDVILMAPQAEVFYKSMLAKSDDYKQKVILLDEKMFVTGKPEEIYNYIKTGVEVEKEYEEQKFQLTLKLLSQIIFESMIGCFPIVFFGVIAFILSYIPMFSFSYALFETTIGFLNIYFSYAIGFKYGTVSKSNPYMMGLITFATSMMINNGFDLQATFYSSFSGNGLFMLISIIIKDIFIVTFFSILTILLLDFLRKIFDINFKENNQSVIMINQSIVFGFIFLVFLVIRVVFKG